MKSGSKVIIKIILIVLGLSMILGACSLLSSGPKKQNSATISQSNTLGSLKVRIQKVVYSHYLGDNKKYSEADEGKIYCNVFLTVENVGTSAIVPESYSFYLLYDNQYKYNTQWTSTDMFFQEISSIIPLETVEGTCVSFEVPEIVYEQNEKPLTLNLTYNSRYNDNYVEWIIR